MDEFAQYKRKAPNTKSENEFAKYKRTNSKAKTIENSLPTLGAKAFTKGIMSSMDIPKLATKAIQTLARYNNDEVNPLSLPKADSTKIVDLSEYVPDSNFVRDSIKKNFNIDLEPNPITPEQRIFTNALETAGGFSSVGGLLSKFKNAAKLAKTGAGIGTGSGILQEAGIDPLYADLATLGTHAATSIPANLIKRFAKSMTKSGRTAAKEEKVSKLLKELTKEKELDNLIKFNPEKMDLIPVTAEVALNKDISNLHNAYAPNLTRIQNKQAFNDEILRKRLNTIGNELNPNNIELGESAREIIGNKLNELEQIREKAASPLYERLEKSSNLYPTKNFNDYTNLSIKQELGDVEKELKKNQNILPNKYKKQTTELKRQLAEFQKSISSTIAKIDKSYPKLNEKTKQEILYQFVPQELEQVKILQQEIAKLESGLYSPGHIDKAITAIANNISQLKRSEKAGNKSLLRHFKNQKKALQSDLENTPEGLAHREVYRQYSPEINTINRDKLLKKFVDKDEFDKYKIAVDDLPRHIMQSPKDSLQNYMNYVKGTDAEELTKAYFRNNYLGKAIDNNLPTFDKSNLFLKEHSQKLDAVYSPEELEIFNRINNYLKNRAEVAKGNSSFGSATMPKQQLQETVRSYLGHETNQPFNLAKYIPGLPFKQNIAKFTTPNTTYNVLEQALIDPVYAQKLLTKKPYIKKNNNYLPALATILNQNKVSSNE